MPHARTGTGTPLRAGGRAPGPRALVLSLGVLLILGCRGPEDRSSPLRFSRVTGGDLSADVSSSPSASWADIDGDGDDDLYVLNGYPSLEAEPDPQENVLYHNRGGVLTAAPDHSLIEPDAFSGSGVWADYDEDGDLDLFVANQRGADNHLFRNDGGDGFTRIAEGPPVRDGGRSFSAAWVDVDGDGRLDLHVLNGRDGRGGEPDFAYRNEGGGRFTRMDPPFAADSLASGGAVWADYDGDGDRDVFLPVYSGEPNRLYRNEGDWRFTEVADSAGITPGPFPFSPPASVAHWVDYDNDGDLDLFVGTTGGRADLLYENRGGGRLERTVAGRLGLDATYVSDAVWVDLENDADLDLVIAVWGGASEVYRNQGDGRLVPAAPGGFGSRITFASSVSASDFDADGDPDLLLTQWPLEEKGGAPNLLYRNDGPAGNWLEVALRGTRSNRSGIGARITVSAEIRGEEVRQLRHVSSRTSWRSTGDLDRRFGLADAATVERVEVRWPSGGADTIEGPIDVNRRLVITEGG